MYTADTAGGENLDAGHMCNNHGGGDGCSTVFPSGYQNRQVTAARFRDSPTGFAQVFNFIFAETCLQPAADHSDRCGDGTVFPDGLLHKQSSLHIFRVGHAVRDDGALQSNNGLACGQCFCNFRRDVEILIHFHNFLRVNYTVLPILFRMASTLKTGLIVSILSMAMDEAARAAIVLPSRSVPCR